MVDTTDFEEVILKTGIDPSFLEETLTEDIELSDALFDLIDNSIDAARNQITSTEFEKDIYGLPNGYSGYHITLRISKNRIVILDNCSGFDSQALENRAFFTGTKSNHSFGIGHFGLGLKRALLKVGSKFDFSTDNGSELYRSSFKTQSLSGDKDSPLKALKGPSNGTNRTIFVANELKQNIVKQIHDRTWLKNLKEEIAIRYSIFLEKGLEIKVVNSISSFCETVNFEPALPKLREDCLIDSFSDQLVIDDVSIHFDVGVHESYLFAGEYEHNANSHKKISKDFGLYFICNDRVIVRSSRDRKYGFTAQFHSEHNGFVCLTRIISDNPKKLPWNTSKTELKVNSPLFLELRDKIEPLALRYRSEAKKLINIWTDDETKGLSLDVRRDIFWKKIKGEKVNLDSIIKKVELSKPDSKEPNSIKSGRRNKDGVKKNTARHSENWLTLIPDYFPIGKSDSVLDNMLIEASTLYIKGAPHASCLLYRSLMEAALKQFVKKTNNYQNVITHFYEYGEGKKKNHNDEYKQNQGLSLSMVLHWLSATPAVFPVSERKKLNSSVKSARSSIGKMNAVVHCLNIINSSEMTDIRNKTILLLEFLVLGVTAT